MTSGVACNDRANDNKSKIISELSHGYKVSHLYYSV